MIKRFTYAIIAILMAFSGVAMVAAYTDAAVKKPRSHEEIAKIRAERTRTAGGRVPRRAPMKVMGGANGDKQLYGLHCPSMYGSDESGIAAIGDNDFTWVKKLNGNAFQGCYAGDRYLAIYHTAGATASDISYVYYDTETWEQVSNGVSYTPNSPDVLPSGLTYDHTSDRIYGCFFHSAETWFGDGDAQFGYVTDDITEPVKIVGELPERMRAVATDRDGQVYGLSFAGTLYKINKFTADCEELLTVELPVASPDADVTFPFDTYGRESIAVDWETGDFYLAYGDDYGDTYVARIDIHTGEVEMVGDYSYDRGGNCEVFTGLYFVNGNIAPENGTPAAVSDMKVEPVGTELKASVSFVMPTVDTEGNELGGTLKWRISDGKSDLLTGNAAAGAPVSETVDVAAEGNNVIVVYAVSGNAESNPVSDTKYIGPDVPVVSGRPTLAVSGKDVTVRWTEAYGQNGGNLAPVSYKVVRMPDGFVVAEACTETAVGDAIASDYKKWYTYTVTPVAGPKQGEAVESRGRYIGTYFEMPFTENFDNNDRFNEYPVSDNNQDGNTWDINLTRKAAVYAGNKNAANDFLLVGPFDMKKGCVYSFSMLAGGHDILEKVAVYTAVIDGERAQLKGFIPKTDVVAANGNLSLSKTFVPETDDACYFAIAACSDANSQYLYVYNVSVKEHSGDCPSMPENVEFVPGAKTCTFNFTMPTKTIGGNALTGLAEARVYRDGTYIGSVTENVAAGAKVSFVDTDETVTDGHHRYGISAVNAQGESPAVEMNCYRGYDFPGSPTNLRLWEDLATPGLIHVTFDAPKRGYYGGYVNPDEISYFLDYLVMGGVADDVELGYGTTHTFTLPMSVTQQDVFAGSVYGRNSKGAVRQSWVTDVCTFGPALSLPIHESWEGMGQKSGIWTGQSVDTSQPSYSTIWDISDGSASTIKPMDGDGGYLAMSVNKENTPRRMLSPRFAIGNAKNPSLVFYYQYTADVKDFMVEVMVEDQVIRKLCDVALEPGKTGQWIRCEVPLKEFIGTKYIQLAFTGSGKVGEYILGVDNVTISDLVEHDLAVETFSSEKRCDINTELAFNLRLRNNGAQKVEADAYTVRLYKNGKMMEEVSGRELDVDGETTYELHDTPVVTDPASTEYYAEVVYDKDLNKANNESSHLIVRVITPDYPTVTDLEGEAVDGVTLTWSDPNMSDLPGTPVTESFESYPAFAIGGIGDWTLYDGDKCPTVTMALETGVLDYPHIGEPMAWQVFDPVKANIPFSSWDPRTGSNALVSFQACVGGTRDTNSDDWLVSPELDGSGQTISFYARAAMKAYAPELFDFMVSSVSADIKDFTALASNVELPYTGGSEWTEYTYNVPAGTRYFAIVHKSYNKLAMIVDDITYIPAGSQAISLELQGFNVYRDGTRLNGEPVAENEYVDTDAQDGVEYTYAVTAVWDKGESPLSNTVTIKATTGIGYIASHELKITGTDGGIRVEGGQGEEVRVYNAAGVCVGIRKADGTIVIPVPSDGVYVVKVGNAVAKVAVY